MFELSIAPRPAPGTVSLAGLFGEGAIARFERGRDGLRALLAAHELAGDDEVAIVTTSDSRYVSACVTDTIAQRCRHARAIGARTKMVLVIHEWGFPRADMPALAAECQRRGVLLVEDCAYALGTYFVDPRVGRDGDYTMFSLPKFFSTGDGGLLLSPKGLPLPASTVHGDVVVDEPRAIAAARRAVWQSYVRAFGGAAYPGVDSAVPGVFLLPCADRHQDLKPYLQARGVEAGFWYGNEHLFLPCHQQMTDADVLRVRDLIATKVGHVELQ